MCHFSWLTLSIFSCYKGANLYHILYTNSKVIGWEIRPLNHLAHATPYGSRKSLLLLKLVECNLEKPTKEDERIWNVL